MKLRVWWIPQVPMKRFFIPVNSVEEGKKILEVLAAYDAWQLQNRVKPDYTNLGGLEMYCEDEEEWCDWYLETDSDYFDDVDDYCEQCESKEELAEFNQALFEQIDWKIIDKITG